MRKIFFIALALISFICYAQTKKIPTVTDFQGRWMVTDVVGYADMGGGVPHAKELLGQVMAISADGIDFNRDTCKADKGFRVREVDTASELKQNDGALPNDAELPAKAYMLDSTPCLQIYWRYENAIEFDDMGVFVRAYRDK